MACNSEIDISNRRQNTGTEGFQRIIHYRIGCYRPLVRFFEPKTNPFLEALDRFGRELVFGPGFRVRRAGDAPEDPVCGLFEFVIWDRLRIYAAVTQAQAETALLRNSR